jgi:hypothetical protein
MASVGKKVFVLGGESFEPANPDDYTMVHVLDTGWSRPNRSVNFRLMWCDTEHINYSASKSPWFGWLIEKLKGWTGS